jgi:hypothetical protein
MANSMSSNAWIRLSHAVSMVKKSHATMLEACWAKNCGQVAAASAGRRPKTATGEQLSDRRGRLLDPELLELALDAFAAPSQVLFC